MGLSHAFSASRAAAAEVIRNADGWQERMRLFRFCGLARNQRRATESAAASAPRNTSTPPASTNNCDACRAGTNGTARMKMPTNASDPARTIVSSRAAFDSGRVAARTPQNIKIAPSATTPAGRAGSPIRPVAASRISSAPNSSTINSLSSRKRFVGVAIGVSNPRAIIRQAAHWRNRTGLANGPIHSCGRAALAGRARNDTMGCLVRRAGLQHRMPGRKFSA
jgi:hypothetical protein